MQSQHDVTLFKPLPKEYEFMINNIRDETINKLYSKINFQYLKLSNIKFGQQIIDDYNDNNISNDDAKILFSLINGNFSTIEIKNSKINSINIKNDYNLNNYGNCPNPTPQIVNVIICNEFKCTIIEEIRVNVIKKLIDALKKEKALIIDVTNSQVEIDIKEEIKNFRFYFRDEINNNKFVHYTISPIIIYMIRRFFYPRDIFLIDLFLILVQTTIRIH